jgi:8-oxo-dGTP diphosphatase
MDYQATYPALFAEKIWANGQIRANFELLGSDPAAPLPTHLIANVSIIARQVETGRWCIVLVDDRRWGEPGGTLEPDEHYEAAARRELMEEAGARLLKFTPFGIWHCHSSNAAPYRPHIPHPHYCHLVGRADVEIVGSPLNPPGGENITLVEWVAPNSLSCTNWLTR